MNIKQIVLVCFGIYLAALLTARVAYLQTSQSNVVISAQATSSAGASLGYLFYVIGALLVISIIVLVVGKREGLFRKILGVYFGLFTIGMTFVLASIYVNGLSYWIGVAFVLVCCAVVAYLYVKKRIQFLNVFGVILAVTAPIVISFDLNLITIAILLIIISVYDVIAVFWTRHMQKMARIMLVGGDPIPSLLVFGNYKEMAERIGSVSCMNCYTTMKKVDGKENRYICPNCDREVTVEGKKIKIVNAGNLQAKKKVKKTFALGLGDLILPSLYPIGLMIKFGMFRALLSIVGATIGVFLNLYIVKKKNITMPAMPLIVACMFIASVL